MQCRAVWYPYSSPICIHHCQWMSEATNSHCVLNGSLMDISLKIKLPNGNRFEVFYPFMLFNADILVRMLSALQPALVSLAQYMGANERKPVYVSNGGSNAADLFNALTHMTGKHAQGNCLQNNARDPECHRLRKAYFEMLVGRTGDAEQDAIRWGWRWRIVVSF